MDNIEKLNNLFPHIREYQKLASELYSINDVFQDNGGKLLQVLMITGLQNLDGSREGNDAVDSEGNEYKFNTVFFDKSSSKSTYYR